MTSVFPIREISSYNRKWKIKARITNKGELRTFDRKNGTLHNKKCFWVFEN